MQTRRGGSRTAPTTERAATEGRPYVLKEPS